MVDADRLHSLRCKCAVHPEYDPELSTGLQHRDMRSRRRPRKMLRAARWASHCGSANRECLFGHVNIRRVVNILPAVTKL